MSAYVGASQRQRQASVSPPGKPQPVSIRFEGLFDGLNLNPGQAPRTLIGYADGSVQLINAPPVNEREERLLIAAMTAILDAPPSSLRMAASSCS